MFLQINIAVHQVKKTATGEERKTALPNWQEKAITSTGWKKGLNCSGLLIMVKNGYNMVPQGS